MSDSICFCGYQKTKSSNLLSFSQFSELIERYFEMGYPPVQGLAYPPDKPANLVDINTAKNSFLDQLKSNKTIVGHNFWHSTFEFDLWLDNTSQAMWAVGTTYEDLGRYASVSIKELCSESFINVIKAAIEVYKPCYGCIFNEIRNIPDPSLDELPEVSEIYEVNFFSFELVEHRFNEQLLLSAPAWKVEKLSCGFLVVPSLMAVYGPGSDENTLSLVASHLGLKT